ncbi:hypothetical protein AC1031_019561 [Aphanomyces cochlioides]|nr:hypothetical protein AC1031_019561 [Aphanomyces cochlioides]
MNYETKLRYFKSYCMENLTLENLMLHMDVEEAKRPPNQSFIRHFDPPWLCLLQKAMDLPVQLMANIAKAHQGHHDTALLLLQDKIAHRILKKFLRMRRKEHYVAFKLRGS